MQQESAPPLMLSVSGCRGIVGKCLTPDVVCRFAGAVVAWIRNTRATTRPAIVLAGDGRRGGSTLRRLTAESLAASGCRVIDLGTAMTPTVGVMVVHHRADAGLTLTASHNPAEWNGLKVITHAGAAPDPLAADAIIELFRNNRASWTEADRFGEIEQDPTGAAVHADRVLDALARSFDLDAIRARQTAVVVDSVNASGSSGARRLLESLGCRLIHLNADESGIFPHPPEPTSGNLAGFAAEVARRGAAVGFAQDPDADRLAVIDEAGRYIGEEYTLVLAAIALLGADRAASTPMNLVANLSTSRMIDDVASRMGARVHRAAVGEANVVSTMTRVNAILGGEGNGGVIWPPVTLIRDSLSAMALTLALMTREDKPLSEIIRAVPAYAIEKRKIELRPGLAGRALDAAKHLYNGPDVRIDEQDGVRIDFPAPGGKGSAWLHVRASNTEPILRLIAEAPTADDARKVLDEAQARIGR